MKNPKTPMCAKTFQELSGLVHCERTKLASIRYGDPRFPRPGPDGWPVFAVRCLLAVREIEAESDADYGDFLRSCDIAPAPKSKADAVEFLMTFVNKARTTRR